MTEEECISSTMGMVDLYAHIRRRITTKFPEGSSDLEAVMELIADGISDLGKGEEILSSPASRKLYEDLKKERYGGYPVGTDPTAGLDQRAAGRPGKT